MSATQTALAASAAIALALALGGCAYDYLQHTDRVSYSAGNAVKANLESETIDPEAPGNDSTKGLGKNGAVVQDTKTLSTGTSTSN